MHSSKRIHDVSERSRFEHNPLQPAFRGSFAGSAPRRAETLGRLDGATLTERVTRFLERYEKPLYAFR